MTDDSPESKDIIESDLGPGYDIRLVPEPNRELLSEKQLVDYRAQRRDFLEWMLHLGKDPDKAEGYSPYTVYETGYRTAAFDRWVWERDGYQLPTPEHGDEYLQEVAYSDQSQSTKGKTEEAMARYFRWMPEHEWDPEYSFESSGSSGPRDFLTRTERRQIRQAALDIDDGWLTPSMVWTSLDAGLRPVEVKRATVDWVDLQNGVLRIPREDSSKNDGNWTVSLTNRTTEALGHWLDERDYESDLVWQTSHGNPYGSQSLSRLLDRLAVHAGIRTENRQLSWYAIRHSVGTYMAREEGLAAAQAQLRHKSTQTTMKYDQVPVEDRRDALDRMG